MTTLTEKIARAMHESVYGTPWEDEAPAYHAIVMRRAERVTAVVRAHLTDEDTVRRGVRAARESRLTTLCTGDDDVVLNSMVHGTLRAVLNQEAVR